MKEKTYITYEQPFEGRTFTYNQMREVYRDMVDKTEYQDFNIWLADMLKSGVFEEVIQMNKELQLLDDIEEIRQKARKNPVNYPTDYTIRLITAIVAEYLGYANRNEWTSQLKNNSNSKYATRLKNDDFYI